MAKSARDVAVVGVYTTEQKRNSGRTTLSLLMEAIRGALDDAGLSMRDVNGFMSYVFPAGSGGGVTDSNVATQFGQPFNFVGHWTGSSGLLVGAAAIRQGLCDVAVMCNAFAQDPDRSKVATYARPGYEFTEWTGSMTPGQYAMLARRHMHLYGTTAEQFAYTAATIRNNGHVNPGAVMFQRGPYTVDSILSARMVADPFTLPMCSLTNDGGSCVVLASAERARDCRKPPVWIMGGAFETISNGYYEPPSLDILDTRKTMTRAFDRAGIKQSDVDLVMAYDHFGHSIIFTMEGFGFCKPGEGGEFIKEVMGLDQQHPVCPDGGNLSYSHNQYPHNFKITEAVRQFRNEVPDLCPRAHEGIHTYDRSICRKVRDPKLAMACSPMAVGRNGFALLAND